MYHFVINPQSRSGRGEAYWKELKQYLDQAQIPYQASFSCYPGHTTELTAAAVSGQGSPDDPVHLVVVGGDGTMNEALQGIPDFSSVLFSYLATGSGNDLARDLRLPAAPLPAFRHLHENGRELRMDLGCLHYGNAFDPVQKTPVLPPPDRYFCVSCGIGFDAAVCQQVNASRLKTMLNRIGLGKLAYLGIGVYQLFASAYQPGTLTLSDGSAFRLSRLFFTAGMCHRFEGGGFAFCPQADAADGCLDFCTVGTVPRARLPFLLVPALFGKHTGFQGVTMARSPSAQIRTAKPLPVHTDGETPFTSSDITLTCHRQKLRFYC